MGKHEPFRAIQGQCLSPEAMPGDGCLHWATVQAPNQSKTHSEMKSDTFHSLHRFIFMDSMTRIQQIFFE